VRVERLSYSDSKMAAMTPKRRDGATWRILLAVLCAVLVVVAGAAQVIHMHADGTDTHADCSLCAAAHLSVHVATAPAPLALLVVSAMPGSRQRRRPVIPVSHFALFTRPPPAA
jgi:hypothetical protein